MTGFARWTGLLLFAGSSACGYAPVREVVAPGPLAVVRGEGRVADARADDEAVLGAKAALAREGVAREDGFPRLVIELVRLEERSSGILAAGGDPRARGVTLTLVGRAYVVGAPDGEPEWESGDVALSAEIAAGNDPRADALARDDGLRALARKLGQALVERRFGYPASAAGRL